MKFAVFQPLNFTKYNLFNIKFYDKFSFFSNLLLAILQNELPLKYSIFQSSAQVEKLKYCALQHFIEKEVEIPKRFLCVQDLFLRGGTASISSIVIHIFISGQGSLLAVPESFDPLQNSFEDACS